MKRHQADVANFMTKDPIVVTSNATIFEAYSQMMEHDVRRLPVVDSDGTLVGILTLSDIQRVVAINISGDMRETEMRSKKDARLVGDVMTSDPICVAPDDSVQEAAENMLEYQVSGLPIVEGDHVIGIITESDIFRLVVSSWTPEGISSPAY